jgi:hypothetical protein
VLQGLGQLPAATPEQEMSHRVPGTQRSRDEQVVLVVVDSGVVVQVVLVEAGLARRGSPCQDAQPDQVDQGLGGAVHAVLG